MNMSLKAELRVQMVCTPSLGNETNDIGGKIRLTKQKRIAIITNLTV